MEVLTKSFYELWEEYTDILNQNKKDEQKQQDFQEHLNNLIIEVDSFIDKYIKSDESCMEILPQMEKVIKERYLMTYQNGEKDKDWGDVSRRVARTVASQMTLYFDKEYLDIIRNFERVLERMLVFRIFIFNSPALFSLGAGISKDFYKDFNIEYGDYKYIYDHLDRVNFTSSACFILDVDDSIEGIFDTMKDAGLISKSGGGIGINIGELRPRYGHIKSSDSDSSGSVEFLKMYDSMGQVIKQGSKRRFAGMAVLLDSSNKFWEKEASLHPDVIEFYEAKRNNNGESVLSVFNLSIGINNSMDLVKKYEKNEDIPFTFKGKKYEEVVDPKIDKSRYKTSINAREFLNNVAESAWKSGDPGLLLFDKINKYNPFRDIIPMRQSNPCGERPGISSSRYGIYDTCDLGHLDVNKFIFDKENKNSVFDVELDTNSLLNAARLSYYFLDFLHDLMMYPIDEVKKGVLGFRSVGLGFYGLAGSLIRLGIPYNSKKGRAFGYNIMKILETGSLFESYEAAKYLTPMMFNKIGDPSIVPAEIWFNPHEEYEKFNEWGSKELDIIFNKTLSYLKDDILNKVINRRNINTTTVAPTGTTSQLGFTKQWGDVGSGIEPIFSFHYERTIVSKNREKSKVEYTAEIADRLLPEEIKDYFKEHNGDLSELDSKYDVYKDIFVSANNIDFNDHIEMQEAVQWCCSSAISKTINMPNSATVEDVKNAYLKALKSPVIKGITIYRDGSLQTQVLSSKTSEKKDTEKKLKEGFKEEKISDKLSFLLDDKGKIRSKPRAKHMLGVVRKFETQKTKNYLTLSFDEDKNPTEVFLTNGSEKAEIIGRLSSIALRAGVSIEEITKQLDKIEHEYSRTVSSEIKKALQVLDNITVIVNENINQERDEPFDISVEIEKGNIILKNSNYYDTKTGEIVCPNCGERSSLEKTEGCISCRSCSWSACS